MPNYPKSTVDGIKPEENCIGKPCLIGSAVVPFQMTETCSTMSNVITPLGWVSTTIVELVFLSLVLWKARKTQKSRSEYSIAGDRDVSHSVDIIGVMARDSKRYFLQ